MSNTMQRDADQPKELQKLAFLGVAVFLILNALTLQVWAWAIAVISILWLLLSRRGGLAIPRHLAWLMAAPFCIILLGLQGFYSYPLADVTKDVWYFAGPLVYLALGYFVAERVPTFKHVVYLFSVVGMVVSAYTLYHVYTNHTALFAASSAEQYRQSVGVGAGQSMIPVVLIAIARRAGIDLGILDRHPLLRHAVSLTGSVAIAFALSRTLLIILIAGVALTWTRAFFFKRVAVVLALAGCVLLVTKLPSLSGNAVSASFVDKIMHTGQEISPGNYGTMAQINDNWRGFEGYRAIQTYDQLPALKHLVGGGFGTLVNLGFNMNLGGPVDIQEIPILHNGYLYLLVKTGFVGIAIFLFFLLQLGLLGRRLLRTGDSDTRCYGFVLLWSVLTFLMTQGVITGIYNKGVLAPNVMLVGMVIAFYARREARSTEPVIELQVPVPWANQARWPALAQAARHRPTVLTGTVLTRNLLRQCE